MSYDPRSTALADALFDERSGKTVRIVADDAARDALNPGGPMVAVTEHDDLINIYDPTTTTWIKRGEQGAIKVDTPEDLLTIESPDVGDIAVVRVPTALYCFDGTSWVACGGGGGEGSGIQKVATFADLANITGLEDGDTAIITTTNEIYAYDLPTNKWTLAVTGTRSVAGGASWQLVQKFKINDEIINEVVENITPGRYRLTIESPVGMAGGSGVKIKPNGADTGYEDSQHLVSVGTNTSSIARSDQYISALYPGWEHDSTIAAASTIFELVVDAASTVVTANAVCVQDSRNRALPWEAVYKWIGNATSLEFSSATACTCTITLSKWEDILSTAMHNYELVEDIQFNGEHKSVDIAIDPDGMYYFEYSCVAPVAGQSITIFSRINDIETESYIQNYTYKGATDSTHTFDYYGLSLGGQSLTGNGRLFPKSTNEVFRAIIMGRHTRRHPYGEYNEYINSLYMNMGDVDVTKLTIFSNTGNEPPIGYFRLYKIVESRLLDNGIKKVTNQAALTSEQVYDGKLALTLDEKQLWVYDQPREQWLGRGGIKSSRNMMGWVKTKEGTFNSTKTAIPVKSDKVMLKIIPAVGGEIHISGNEVYDSNYITSMLAATDSPHTDSAVADGFVLNDSDSWSAAQWSAAPAVVELEIINDILTFKGNLPVVASDGTQVYTRNLGGGYVGITSLQSVTVHSSSASGAYELYEWQEAAVPDFLSAMPALYGWQKIADGVQAVENPEDIDVSGFEKVMIDFSTEAVDAMRTTHVRVNGKNTGYSNAHIYNGYNGTTGTVSARVATTSGLHPIPSGFTSNHTKTSAKMEIIHSGTRVQANGIGQAYGEDNEYPNGTTYAGFLDGELALNTVAIVGTSDNHPIKWAVYGWTAIEIPFAAPSGYGLSTYEVIADRQIYANGYYMVDTSSGPVSIEMPSEAAIGDEIVILDAMRTFGTAGHECTLNPGTALIESGDTLVELDATGKEYKLRYVGGTMGWRMI